MDEVGHERIRAIDDEVVFKARVHRWRGAVWSDTSIPWLIAADIREDGSGDDFYQALTRDAQTAHARYNAEHARPLGGRTHVGHLLPTDDDHKRHHLEEGTRLLRRLIRMIRELARGSLRDGHEHAADLPGFRLALSSVLMTETKPTSS